MARDIEIDVLLDHIAFSFVHGGFDPDSTEGGCSCPSCRALSEKIKAIREKEYQEYLRERNI